MKAEILSIGRELLMGELVDTNAAYIASQLPRLGFEVQWITQVGDDIDHLVEAFGRAFRRSQLVVSTGGLGPTQDDLTRESIARLMGEEMKVDPGLLANLEEIFRRRGIPMPPSNIKQATLIPSAKAIPNPRGTAPGWWVEKDGRIIVTMPGPPGEVKEMWEGWVFPRLQERFKGQVIVTRAVKTLGLTEAAVGELVSPFFGKENPYLGIYAKPDGIHLRVIARAQTEEAARELIRPVDEAIRAALEPYIWGYDDETPEQAVGALLKQHKLTLATMESCTGGLLASTITDVPGSSEYYKGGIVSYTNEVKELSGVPSSLIRKYGAISQEVAEAMAQAARDRLGADLGIGVTGVAGPSEVVGKPVGTVFTAISMNDTIRHVSSRLPARREVIKRRTVTMVLVELARLLRARPGPVG